MYYHNFQVPILREKRCLEGTVSWTLDNIFSGVPVRYAYVNVDFAVYYGSTESKYWFQRWHLSGVYYKNAILFTEVARLRSNVGGELLSNYRNTIWSKPNIYVSGMKIYGMVLNISIFWWTMRIHDCSFQQYYLCGICEWLYI